MDAAHLKVALWVSRRLGFSSQGSHHQGWRVVFCLPDCSRTEATTQSDGTVRGLLVGKSYLITTNAL